VFLKMGNQTTVNTVQLAAGQTLPGSAFVSSTGSFLAPAKLPVSLHVKQGATSV
jgi:hypothetical protein